MNSTNGVHLVLLIRKLDFDRKIIIIELRFVLIFFVKIKIGKLLLTSRNFVVNKAEEELECCK